jgi:hypothetical protein
VVKTKSASKPNCVGAVYGAASTTPPTYSAWREATAKDLI